MGDSVVKKLVTDSLIDMWIDKESENDITWYTLYQSFFIRAHSCTVEWMKKLSELVVCFCYSGTAVIRSTYNQTILLCGHYRSIQNA